MTISKEMQEIIDETLRASIEANKEELQKAKDNFILFGCATARYSLVDGHVVMQAIPPEEFSVLPEEELEPLRKQELP